MIQVSIVKNREQAIVWPKNDPVQWLKCALPGQIRWLKTSISYNRTSTKISNSNINELLYLNLNKWLVFKDEKVNNFFFWWE